MQLSSHSLKDIHLNDNFKLAEDKTQIIFLYPTTAVVVSQLAGSGSIPSLVSFPDWGFSGVFP